MAAIAWDVCKLEYRLDCTEKTKLNERICLNYSRLPYIHDTCGIDCGIYAASSDLGVSSPKA